MPENPYKNQPDRAFWKRAIATRHYEDITELWMPPPMDGTEKFATAGSCFAQHIGRHVSARSEGNYLDLEPAPIFLPGDDHARFGYGIYSCRYGNIYTSRQLVQLAHEALGTRPLSQHVWQRDGRYYDALRPTVDPVGQADASTVIQLRAQHIERVAEMFRSLDIMIFTLGLTEGWVSPADGTAFPTAPGVVADVMSAEQVEFHNFGIDEVRSDMSEFWSLLKEVNPKARMILTVSPVPLIATASGEHVLPATMYSKSVLRVAAQELSDAEDDVHYFPSYEIVNSAQGRGYYFEPDLRSVNERGVGYVMEHFFTGDLARHFARPGTKEAQGDVVCDEEAIEAAS